MTNGLRVGFALTLLIFAVTDVSAALVIVENAPRPWSTVAHTLFWSRAIEAAGLATIGVWIYIVARARRNGRTV